MFDAQNEIKKIREFLLDYNRKAGTKGYILGISGGIDSSVLFKILEPLEELDLIAVMFPIHSMNKDEEDARELIKGTKRKILKVDLTSTYDEFLKVLPDGQNELANSNMKPRLRMTALYQIGQTNQLLVAGATNYSEYMTGYFTKHGDSGVDIMPLAEYYKSEIYKMAEVLQVPDKIIDKPPSAGLLPGQTDEKEMGVSYGEIEEVLKDPTKYLDKKEKIEKMIHTTAHKRMMPAIYKRGV